MPSEAPGLAARLELLLPPERARQLLVERVGREIHFLDKIAGNGRLTHAMVCAALVAFTGAPFLSDSAIRKSILENLPEGEVATLFEYLAARGSVKTINRRRAVMDHGFVSGSSWARQVCETIGLPYECAGQSAEISNPPVQFVPPLYELPPLHDYQAELLSEIKSVLQSKNRRAMVALPTGAGKTRVLMDAVLDFPPVEQGQRSVLWVAQHEELCEQAISCIIQVWGGRRRPADRPLKVQRVWEGKSADIDWSADIVVGIPQSLGPRLLADRGAARARLGVTVIDEAHLSMGTAYTPIFRVGSVAPIIGISATPARSNDAQGVLKMVYGKLLRSHSLGSEPVRVLRERGVLAEILYESIDSGFELIMTPLELAENRQRPDYDRRILERIGRDIDRNERIVERLLDISPGSPTLGFLPTVASARALAAAMTVHRRSAAVIDAATPATLRQRVLSDFKAGGVQFLFNHGVLVAGFDAPNVENLLLARPTRSHVLLEQMIGRGLRGPANGGTPMCRLIWIKDHFSSVEELEPLGYERFAHQWR